MSNEDLKTMTDAQLEELIAEGRSAMIEALDTREPAIFKCDTGGYLVGGIHGPTFSEACVNWMVSEAGLAVAKSRLAG